MWVSFKMALLYKETTRWLGYRMERLLAIQHLGAYLWHTGSTSSHWWGRWGGRSSWRCHDCCRSWYDGWGWRCLPPRSCPLCDRPLDSGYSASDDLCANQRRGEHYAALIFFLYFHYFRFLYGLSCTSTAIIIQTNHIKQCWKTFTFTGSLQISLQATGRTDVLGAAKSSSWTAGGAQVFPHTILMVKTTAAWHRTTRHFSTRCFTAKTGMTAWRWQSPA